MQVQRLPSPPDQLKQGSIFTIDDGLTFPGQNEQEDADGAPSHQRYTFKEFYPHVDFAGVTYGIVMSQSCDLVVDPGSNRPAKVPHITVGFLEPFGRYLKREGVSWPEAVIVWPVPTKPIFVSPTRFAEAIKSKFEKLLQNNEKCHFFFISLDDPGLKPSAKHFVVDLTKAVPIRVEHYKLIAPRVTHELKEGFGNKLGWKIAELYGRIGTEDYESKALGGVINELSELVAPVMREKIPSAIEIEDALFQKAISLRNNPKTKQPTYEKFYVEAMDSLAQASEKTVQLIEGTGEVMVVSSGTQLGEPAQVADSAAVSPLDEG